MVRVLIPATTANMGPGFDTMGMALEIYNSVEMEEIKEGLNIECLGLGEHIIPKDESNTVYQAALKVWQRINYKPKGIKIRLKSDIPLSSGLGSSAAAIVGGMVAANALAGYKLKEEEILDLATKMEGHPDNVAPALLGGIVISTLEKDTVFYSKIKPPKNLACVIVIPDFTLSTKASREVLPEKVPFQDAVFNISRTALLVSALQEGDLNLLTLAMDDKMHQPYRCNLIPGMSEVIKLTKKAGAKGVALSGAGPALIAFIDDNEKEVEKEVVRVIEEIFAKKQAEVNTLVAKPNCAGVKVIEN